MRVLGILDCRRSRKRRSGRNWRWGGGGGTIRGVSNVLVIANNPQQASLRLRVLALQEGLARRGVQLEIQFRPRSWAARRRLLRSARGFDAVLLQRKMLDAGDMAALRKSARRIFFDVDDAVMYHSRPVGMMRRWWTRRRFAATARGADVVVAGNEYLAELFRREGAKAIVLPTVVDPVHYRVKAHEAGETPGLVWIGSRSTLNYLGDFAPALAEAARRVAGLRLITIADQAPAGMPVPVRHIEWSVEGEAEALCAGDIGIAPMPEDRWTLGKCGFKIVQYMAAGLPVVASPVGANCQIVQAGQTGFLARDAAEWGEAIAKLAGDVGLRRAMGEAGRRRVEEEYCVERAAEVWAGLLAAGSMVVN